MKFTYIIVLSVVLGLVGCSMRQAEHRPVASTSAQPVVAENSAKNFADHPLEQTEKALSIEAALDRKIIRDAKLTIEVASTTDAQ
jgi:hypothetical protein